MNKKENNLYFMLFFSKEKPMNYQKMIYCG